MSSQFEQVADLIKRQYGNLLKLLQVDDRDFGSRKANLYDLLNSPLVGTQKAAKGVPRTSPGGPDEHWQKRVEALAEVGRVPKFQNEQSSLTTLIQEIALLAKEIQQERVRADYDKIVTLDRRAEEPPAPPPPQGPVDEGEESDGGRRIDWDDDENHDGEGQSRGNEPPRRSGFWTNGKKFVAAGLAVLIMGAFALTRPAPVATAYGEEDKSGRAVTPGDAFGSAVTPGSESGSSSISQETTTGDTSSSKSETATSTPQTPPNEEPSTSEQPAPTVPEESTASPPPPTERPVVEEIREARRNVEVCTASELLANVYCPVTRTKSVLRDHSLGSCRIHKLPEYSIVEVCRVTSAKPLSNCPKMTIKIPVPATELSDQNRLRKSREPCPVHETVAIRICPITKLRATLECDDAIERFVPANNIPRNCPGHPQQQTSATIQISVCRESGGRATLGCPNDKIERRSVNESSIPAYCRLHGSH